MALAFALSGCSPAPSAAPSASPASPIVPSPDLTAGLRAFDLLRMGQAQHAFAAATRSHPQAPLPHAYLALALNGSGGAADEMATAVHLLSLIHI